MSNQGEITIKNAWENGQHVLHPYTWEFQKDNQSIHVDISDQRLSSIAKVVIALLSTVLAGRYFHLKRRYRMLSTVVVSFLAYYVPLASAKMEKCAKLLNHNRLDFSPADCPRGAVRKPSLTPAQQIGSWLLPPLEHREEEKNEEDDLILQQFEASTARINIPDANYENQLHLERALKLENERLACFLVEKGARFDAKNANGDTPIAAFLKAKPEGKKWYIRKVFKEDKWLQAVIRQSNAPIPFESVDTRHAFRDLLAACLLNEPEWIKEMKQGGDLFDWEVDLVRAFLRKHNCAAQAALLD